jgi:hypothetical protein
MRNIPLKTTLSALLVSVPLAGAFAYDEYDAAAGIARVDTLQTSSIGSATRGSLASQLDVSLRAAETNLQPSGPDSVLDAAAVAELNAIRQAANQERQSNGGELSAGSYRSLSERVRAVQQPSFGVR